MEPKMLDALYHVDTETGFRMRYVKSDTEYFRPHSHNYYEIFLTLSDNIVHLINGVKQPLRRGNLLFIRDFDLHDYASADGKSFEFLNLSFSSETLFALLEYLGDGIDRKRLFDGKLPPQASLFPRDTEKLFYSFCALGDAKDGARAKTEMRALLANVFVKYFGSDAESDSGIPLWLEITCEKMKKPKNFIVGAPRFFELAGKSREHAAREMKRHYGITVTEFVTELRLNHAVNLMKQSNFSITDICFECGFSNLSWFYKLFSGKYGKSPAAYKKELTERAVKPLGSE